MLKFIYSEKAKKFCEISTLLLSVCTVDKSKVEISQNFVAFSEYTNFNFLQNPYFNRNSSTQELYKMTLAARLLLIQWTSNDDTVVYNYVRTHFIIHLE